MSPHSTSASRPLLILLIALALAASAVGAGLLIQTPAATADPRLALPPLQAPGEWFDSQRAIDAEGVDYAQSLDQASALRANAVGGDWTNLGPTNIGGRANDIVTDADDETIVYIAAASGGVWRGTDMGMEWERAWPDDLTQAIGSLDRNGAMLLAGTGEANPGGGSIVYGGTGAYVSSDDGATWDLIGLEDSGAIGRTMAYRDGFLIAATGNLFTPGGERGLYYWAPGMDDPALLFDGNEINEHTGVVDIAVNPEDDDHIMVGTWDHYRSPDARIYSGEGSGLFESRDGGDTWTRIQTITMPDANENGRVAVAFAPSDANRVYAMIANTANGRHGGFWRSDDNGATWAPITNGTLTSTNSSYGWWFGRIYVTPNNPNDFFVMGLNLTRSTNGGSSFSNVAGTHSDNHGMYFDTRVEGLVYLADDGGAYVSTNNGTTWSQSDVQGWTQHYSVDVSDVGVGGAAELMVTGLQDNGCIINADGSTGSWRSHGLCGDGLEAVFVPGNPSISWTCSQYGGCSRIIGAAPDLGVTFPNDARFGWLADIEFDPLLPNVVYTGGKSLWKSTDEGSRWTRLVNDMSTDPEQLDPNTGYQLRGVITSIAPASANVVYVGTDEGLLWKVDANTGDAVRLDDEAGINLPNAWVTSVHATSEDDLYVTYSGFRQGSNAKHVFASHDGGQTFTDISGNLPNAPVNDVIVINGGDLVIGSDTGVYTASLDAPSEWSRVGTNMPSVPVIQVDHEFGKLYAATFGHSIQSIPVDFGSVAPTSGPASVLD